MIKLLVVDDSALMRRLVGGVFAPLDDFELAFARDGVEAIAQAHAFRPDVVTLDVQMPSMDGLTCLDHIMVERPCPVVMVSALTEAGADVTFEALELGAVDFVAKPQGALSLEMDVFGPLLVDTVRAAAKAHLRPTLRLTERVRRLASGDRRGVQRRPAALRRKVDPAAASPVSLGPGAAGAVLVGCSTGGPPALDALLSPLPADFPLPILVAQHMPATFTGPLARRLDGLAALNVQEVKTPTLIRPGNVYVAHGDADMIVSERPEGTIVMAAPSLAAYRWHPSVQRLVETAMEQMGAGRLIGIMMTGMGNDGASAMTRLRAEGGRTIAESEESAVVWGMPGELVRAGGAEIVAPLDAIAGRLMDLVS